MILGIQDLKTISMHSSLAELGMDSMMAVEIKQTLEREFDVALTAQDIRGLTFAKLAAITSGDTGSDGKGGTKVIDIGPWYCTLCLSLKFINFVKVFSLISNSRVQKWKNKWKT